MSFKLGKLATSPRLVFGDSRGQTVNTSANVMNGSSFNTVIGSLTSLRLLDSHFSAFSTEVLNHVSWKHNRSGSPFARLAEQNGT